MPGDYFKHDVWVPASQRKARNSMSPFLEVEAKKVAATSGGGRGGGGPQLPFRIHHVQLARDSDRMNREDGVFVVSRPQPDPRQQGQGVPSAWRFLPPLEDHPAAAGPRPVRASGGAATGAASSPEALDILEELRAALERRDGPAFEAARQRLNGYALSLSAQAASELEEALDMYLGPEWASFAEESPEAAELFKERHIGEAFVVEVDATPSKVEMADATVFHAMMGYSGINLGPRFRTRQLQYTALDLHMRPS